MTVAPDVSPVRTESLVPGQALPVKLQWLERIATRTDLTTACRVTAARLASYSDQHGTNAHPGPARLAAETGQSVRAIKQHLAQLVAARVVAVSVVGGSNDAGRRASVYELAAWWTSESPCTGAPTRTGQTSAPSSTRARSRTGTRAPTCTPPLVSTPERSNNVREDAPSVLDRLPVETITARPCLLDYDELDDLHAFLEDVDPTGIDAAWSVVDTVTRRDATDAQLDQAPGWALAAYVATAQGADAHQTVQAHADRLDADLDRQLLQLLDADTWRARTAAENSTPPPPPSSSLGRWPAHVREVVAA